MAARITWLGGEIRRRAQRAQAIGVNKIMSECVDHAKRNHPWTFRSGTLHGSIRIVRFARPGKGGVRGEWGSADVKYAIYLELGTSRMKPYPYLRPAADEWYPKLAAAIRGDMERTR